MNLNYNSFGLREILITFASINEDTPLLWHNYPKD